MSELARLLADVATFVRCFVVMTQTQVVTVALWVAHTHAIAAADCTPYLAVTSAEKRSGKSRLLEVLELLVRSPLPAANISDAALFRATNELAPTLLFDEVDALFKAKDREDLRGLLCAGHRRGAVAFRIGGAKRTTLERFEVFSAKAFAGIGDCLPDTIKDRSISIRLQRRTREEGVERFRRRDAQTDAEPIHASLSSMLEHQAAELSSARPEIPDELDDRAQDGWEPLIAIADLAGDDWPARARAGQEREDDSLTAKLIADICTVFSESGETRLRTADLIDRLSRIEESPWGDWYGKPISAQALSKLLKSYRIRTMPVRVHGETARGYKLEQFADAFDRVLGVTGVTGVTTETTTDAACNACNACNAPQLELEGPELEQLVDEAAFPIVGDEGYPLALARAGDGGQVTEREFGESLALHHLVERSRSLEGDPK